MRSRRHISDDIEALQVMAKDTDDFTGRAFEWVSTLRENHLLDHLYNFKLAIEAKLSALQEELNQAIKEESENEDYS